jgi:hypothetical protein
MMAAALLTGFTAFSSVAKDKDKDKNHNGNGYDKKTVVVSEPATTALLVTGLVVVAFAARRKRPKV